MDRHGRKRSLLTILSVIFSLLLCSMLDDTSAFFSPKENEDFDVFPADIHDHGVSLNVTDSRFDLENNDGVIFAEESVDNNKTFLAARVNKGPRRKSKCNQFQGTWVRDNSYPFYNYKKCPFVSYKANCKANGRPDTLYEKWRWQPYSCNIPRFNAMEMLRMLRGKKLMFVGDSISQNQWESMVCMLYPYVKESHMEVLTRSHYPIKTFRIPQYRASVDFFWDPFLVELKRNKRGKTVLHLDEIDKVGKAWKRADILVFESSHWWSHTNSWDVIKSGRRKVDMDPMVAYRRALTTWSNWLTKNINPRKTIVFFRTTSPKEDSGRECYGHEYPLKRGDTLPAAAPQEKILDEILRQTKFPVRLLDITLLSAYRLDGHPSVYYRLRKGGDVGNAEQADCSHWCLPGVPDTWNELMYASIKRSLKKMRKRKP